MVSGNHYSEVSALLPPQVALSSLGFPCGCWRRTSSQVCFCCVCTPEAFGCLCQWTGRLLLLRRNSFNCMVLIFPFPWQSMCSVVDGWSGVGAGSCGHLSTEVAMQWNSTQPLSVVQVCLCQIPPPVALCFHTCEMLAEFYVAAP